MKDILGEIVEKKKAIVAEAKRKMPLAEVKARMQPGTFRMSKVFKKDAWNLIAECKLQSPAKGRLNQTHTVEQLAAIYAANGASMLSVHTDPHFLGCNEDFCKVRELVELHNAPKGQIQAEKMRHFGETLSDIVMPDLETVETESSLELNFLIGKLKQFGFFSHARGGDPLLALRGNHAVFLLKNAIERVSRKIEAVDVRKALDQEI